MSKRHKLIVGVFLLAGCSSPDEPSGADGSPGSGGGPLSTGTGGSPSGGSRSDSGGSSSGGSFASGGAPSSSGGASPSGGETNAASGGEPGAGGGVTGGTGSGGNGQADVDPSAGCGSDPTLKNTPGSMLSYNEIESGGSTRRYVLRLPPDYDSAHPYRLILGFHGATGNAGEVAGGSSPYFGLYDLDEGSTIFVAMEAVGGLWSSTSDLVYVDDVLAELEADLCIDKTRVELEGFSQGGAMTYTLACARPGVFRAAVTHSPGGLAMPTACAPIPYFTSLGQQENDRGQTMTADFFAQADQCSIETLPKAPTGGHLCSDYSGCMAGTPVRWCPYDGGHTPSPRDSGQGTSWMPEEVWGFLSQF